MNKKKVLLILIVLLLLTGCKKHSNFTKYNDNLYEITYNDYNDDYFKNIKKEKKEKEKEDKKETNYTKESFGCSSFYTNGIAGRSFDYFQNDSVEFIVRTKKKKNRYASISVSGANLDWTTKMMKKELSEDFYDTLPYYVLDGVNEKGVYVANLVIPSEYSGELTGTNPGKEELYSGLIPRFILDNAKSAKDAIKLLKNRNIVNYDIFNVNSHGFDLHYMIADKNNSYVIEFINNELKVIEDNAVTNYQLSIDKKPHSIGIERYDTIKKGIDKVTNTKDALKLLEEIKYSNAYDTTRENFWYSEFVGKKDDLDITNENIKNYKEQLFKNIENYNVDNRILNGDWMTIHASSYDLNNKVLNYTLFEDYQTVYQFSL